MNKTGQRRLMAFFLMACFSFLLIAGQAGAEEGTTLYSAGEMAARAVEFINQKYLAGGLVDGYSAYVLTLVGEDLDSQKWTRNGRTLKSEIEILADLLGDNNSLITYITGTQNSDGTFGPYANEYGTRVPLQALALVRDDTVGKDVYDRVEESISRAVNYFKANYRNGNLTYEADSFTFDYRCIEALAAAGEDLAADDWVYGGVSLKDRVIDSASQAAGAVNSDPSVLDAVYLAKQLSALYAVEPHSPDVGVLAEAIWLKQGEDGKFGNTIYDHVAVLTALGRAGQLDGIDQVKALGYINSPEHKRDHYDMWGHKVGTAWGSTWDGSFHEEADLTAQVITALSYFDGAHEEGSEVYSTIQEGLAFLADVQDPDTAGIRAEWDSTYATAETLIALKTLGKTYDEYAGSGSTWVKRSRTKTIAQCLLAMNGWNDEGRRDRLAGLLIGRQIKDGPGAGSFENSVYSDMWAYIALGEAGKLDGIDVNAARSYILSKQGEDGSWGESFPDEHGNSMYYPDFLSTVQAIRALYYLPGADSDEEIRAAVDRAVTYLKGLQQDDGGVYNTWEDPAVDNSELIITLRHIGRDPEGEEWTRRAEDGKNVNPVSYLMTRVMNEDGSFGTVKNIFGAAEALYAYHLQREVDIIETVRNAVRYLADQYASDDVTHLYGQFGGYRAPLALTLAGENLAEGRWVKDGESLVSRILSGSRALDDTSSVTDLAKSLIAVCGLGGGYEDERDRLISLIVAKQSEKGNFADGEIYNEMLPYLALTLADGWSSLDENKREQAVNWLVNAQTKEGAEKGSWQHSWGVDTVSTAQAVVVLSTFDQARNEGTPVYRAVQDGLAWLKSKQDDSGRICGSPFDDPVVDTAETVLAVLAAGQNPNGDCWSVNGNSLIDYLLLRSNQKDDGSIGDVESGYSCNVGSTVPALLALLQYNQVFGWVDFVPGVELPGQNNGEGGRQDAGSGSGSSSSPPASDSCTVQIAVCGMNGEWILKGVTVTVTRAGRWGLTALGALDATGLSYSAAGGFVSSIEGQANSGMSGWMYKVNGVVPAVSAADWSVREGDKVIWWYSKDPYSSGPNWGDWEKAATLSEPASVQGVLESTAAIQNRLLSGTLSSGQAVQELKELIDGQVKTVLKDTRVTSREAASVVVQLLEKAVAPLVKDRDATVGQAVEALKLVIHGGVLPLLERSDATESWRDVEKVLALQVKGVLDKAQTIDAAGLKSGGTESSARVNLTGDVLETKLKELALVQQEVTSALADEKLKDVASLARAPVQQLNVELSGLMAQNGSAEILVASGASRKLGDAGIKLAVRVSEKFSIMLAGEKKPAGALLSINRRLNELAGGWPLWSGRADSGDYVLRLSVPSRFELGEIDQDVAKNSSSGLTLCPTGWAYRVEVVDPTQRDLPRTDVFMELVAGYRGLDVEKEILGLYRYEGGRFEFAGASLDEAAETVSALVNSGGTYVLLGYDRRFEDMEGHWAAEDVRRLSARHVVAGMTPTEFAPGVEVTRAQCAAFIVRALGIQKDEASGVAFADVSPTAWYAADVSAVFKAGIMRGTAAARFAPDRPITRLELVVILGRVLESRDEQQVADVASVLKVFGDAEEIPTWAEKDVARAVKYGIVKGRRVNDFVPDGKVNRAEAAVMVGRLLDIIEDQTGR